MKMKCAALAILISLVFASQAFAVLRPLFPVKPGAPFNGDVIIIGDGLVPDSAKKTPAASPESGTAASAWTQRYRLVTNAGPAVGNAFAMISTREKSGME